MIPECTWWWVRSAGEPSGEAVAREVRHRDREIPGLRVAGATDAGLEHLRGPVNLRWLHLGHTQVSDAGMLFLITPSLVLSKLFPPSAVETLP